jgi:hypothetical protein
MSSQQVRFGIYSIEEQTKKEAVARGSSGNILRWSKNRKNEQKWSLVPVSAEGNVVYYNIINVDDPLGYMAVGSNGNILCWTRSDHDDQKFSFAEVGDLVNIKIKGDNTNVVAVDSTGNLVRWSKNGRPDQTFKLIREPNDNPAKPKPLKTDTDDFESTLPNLLLKSNISESTVDNKAFVKETIMPSLLSNTLRNGASIMADLYRSNPYFRVRHYKYWKRLHDITMTYYEGYSQKIVVEIEESVETRKQFREEFDINVSIGVSGSYEGITGSFSTDFAASFNMENLLIKKKQEKYTDEKWINWPANVTMRKTIWHAVDLYELSRIESPDQPFRTLVVNDSSTIRELEWTDKEGVNNE